MTIRMELSSAILVSSSALLAVTLRDSVSPSALGLALTYSLQLTSLFQRSVQLSIDAATYMTSVERIF
jgi:hypothetical protein